MTYQVLARKWRPQDFSSLVGQGPIVTALRNAISEKRVAQAYLFSGIRGVGKTTTARVFAKALNCQARDTGGGDPCNECGSCKDITAGTDLDVVEVDAATYSKVEQVRELTESLRYGTARSPHKVVVLDEVHRFSRQAFDALLKIVEEPPPHLVFIFATTEIDAVPATILSRCQEFQFRRVPSSVLSDYLRRISDAEQLEVSDPALRLIARAGEGSVRDSVALLDQLATFGNGTISDHDAKNLLGGLDAAIFLRLLGAILEGRHSPIAETIAEIEANGWDPQNVYGQFLVYVRDGLHLAMGGSTDSVDLPREEAESLAELVQPVGFENLLRLTKLLLDSEPAVRRSEFGMLAFQVTLLRAAELPKVTRVEDLLTGRATAPVPPAHDPQAMPAVAQSLPAPELRHRSPGEETAPRPPEPAAGPTVSGSGRGATNGTAAALGSVPKFLDQLRSQRPSLAALLRQYSAGIRFENGTMKLPAGDSQLEGALARPANLEQFESTLSDLWGPDAGWQWYDAPTVAAAMVPDEAPRQEVSEHPDPAVRAVLEVFDGSKIQKVQPHIKESES